MVGTCLSFLHKIEAKGKGNLRFINVRLNLSVQILYSTNILIESKLLLLRGKN